MAFTFAGMEIAGRHANLYYHICVFLWGFTAIFGRLISLPEATLVWWRMLFTCTVMLAFPELWRTIRMLTRQQFLKLFGTGILVALHWLAFYGSIKHSNISVALVCLATTSFFTSLIEPLVFRTSVNKREVLLGFAVVPAIYMIYYFTDNYVTGIILGMLSTLFATFFSVFNKKLVAQINPITMTFTELFCGFVFLSILLPVYLHTYPETPFRPGITNTWLLICMSVFCTALPFTLSLYCLRYMSVFSANLLLNLEPVYGIVMAIFIFHENKYLNIWFYTGAFIIIAIISLNHYLQLQKNKRQRSIQ